MTLRDWQANGWLTERPATREEIADLLAIVDRDMHDATGPVSADWRFGIAYNAALKLCTILLRAEGYRPAGGLHHYRTIAAMPLVLGDDAEPDATYLDACRIKRNSLEYDYVGGATHDDATELLDFAAELKQTVLAWLRSNHPHLL